MGVVDTKKLRIRRRRLTGKFDVTHSLKAERIETFDTADEAKAYCKSSKENGLIVFYKYGGKFDVVRGCGRCIVLKTFDNITAARAYRDSLKEGE